MGGCNPSNVANGRTFAAIAPAIPYHQQFSGFYTRVSDIQKHYYQLIGKDGKDVLFVPISLLAQVLIFKRRYLMLSEK